jgi:NADPH-dependent 2,4-dienoyl-CoA reductase/sulfur reductase-like enzyme/rhodanese-related sulfurtransferase
MSLNILIIGGVAGGMSAATRARRMNEHATITVIEAGGFISFANCGLPYHLAGRIEKEESLLLTDPQKVRDRFRIDARVNHEALRVDRSAKRVEIRNRLTGQVYELSYDKLILAVGASPIVPPIDNVRAPNVFLLRSMEDTRAVREYLRTTQPKRAAIIGAGFIGLEMAEALHDRGGKVTIIEKVGHVLPPLDPEIASAVEAELVRKNVAVITGDGLQRLHADESGDVTAVETEKGVRVETDLVLMSIGVRPNITLAKDAGLTIGASGAISVDAYQRTSDPDIYAVGDVSEVTHGVTGKATRIPLAGPANRQGRLAGEHAATGNSQPADKPLGTAIVQVFGVSVGMTGLSERAARAEGLDIDTVYTFPKHHAGYYPGAQTLRMKLVYERGSGRVLGAQVAGSEGVDKRIDVVATLLHFGGKITDLAALDLAYAPQFGSAKDPVHLAAMVAQNQNNGLMPAVTVSELKGQKLIDVRAPSEYAGGSLHGAVNIPVDSLRERMGELKRDEPLVVFCAVGQRGFVAQRILVQSGFKDVKNLKGGFTLART